MSVATDIVQTYRGPRLVMRRLLSKGRREDRALAILMGACGLIFLSQWPPLSRRAHLNGEDLQMLIGGALLAWIFLAPLLLYIVAAISHWIALLFRGQGDHFGARLALFWSLFASSPLLLLYGMTGGFVGPGPELTFVGAVWTGVFIWFWVQTMREAEKP